MSVRLTILGCGSSTGVPKVGGDWGACNPNNPKNRRLRCSLLVEKTGANGTTTVLIDTSPDLRQQLLHAGVKRLDAVLYTHDHADHTHGIDDLRMLAYAQRQRIPVYADPRTLSLLIQRFDYCFATPPGSSYPAIVTAHTIHAPEPVVIEGPGGPIAFQPFRLLHGDIEALGFRTGKAAYTCDLHDIPPESVEHVCGLDLWIINTLRYTPHPSHLTLSQSLAWIERLQPKRAVLTHLHIDLDYDELSERLPPHVTAAYDGMVLDVDAQ
jgi:phosphoribosyl 1,2-cyclic phosphate phosphodiesterase